MIIITILFLSLFTAFAVYGIYHAIALYVKSRVIKIEFIHDVRKLKIGEHFYTRPIESNPYNDDVMVCEVIEILGRWIRYKYSHGDIRHSECNQFIKMFSHISNMDSDSLLNEYQKRTIKEDLKLIYTNNKVNIQ